MNDNDEQIATVPDTAEEHWKNLIKVIEDYLLDTRGIIISCGIGEYVGHLSPGTEYSHREYDQVVQWALKQPGNNDE